MMMQRPTFSRLAGGELSSARERPAAMGHPSQSVPMLPSDFDNGLRFNHRHAKRDWAGEAVARHSRRLSGLWTRSWWSPLFGLHPKHGAQWVVSRPKR
jgi:hypothetical protein